MADKERPLRAIIEILDGEVIIYPVAGSDMDREMILRALQKLHESDKR